MSSIVSPFHKNPRAIEGSQVASPGNAISTRENRMMTTKKGMLARRMRIWSTSAMRLVMISAIASGGVSWPITTAITISAPK
jgi:hypothetical protein